jgi:hypothetical protein
VADKITFHLSNDQMTDVNVSVWDDRNGSLVLDTAPLNQGESVDVQVIADSSGHGAAHWAFASSDGSVNSNKQQTDIDEGDNCTLG